jgi:hypothetical protein
MSVLLFSQQGPSKKIEMHQYIPTAYEEHSLKLAFQTEDCRDNVASPLALYAEAYLRKLFSVYFSLWSIQLYNVYNYNLDYIFHPYKKFVSHGLLYSHFNPLLIDTITRNSTNFNEINR